MERETWSTCHCCFHCQNLHEGGAVSADEEPPGRTQSLRLTVGPGCHRAL